MTDIRPNILVVCTDQQRTDTLSCYGSTFTQTPGFDRIAQDGYRFDRAYCPSAVCTPSRVSLLSGQYASRHGVWSIGVNTGDDITMMQHRLQASGYKTGLIGKAHLEAYSAPPNLSQESVEGFEKGYGEWLGPYYGFDHVRLALGHVNYGMTGHYGAWLRQYFSEAEIQSFKDIKPLSNCQPFGGEAYESALPTEFHNSVWTANSAIEFIDTTSDDQPFFLFTSFQDPHHPHALPFDYPKRIDLADVPGPDYSDGELSDKPPHFRLAREGELGSSRFIGSDYPMSGQGPGADFRAVENSAAIAGRCHYYTMVQLIDDQLQRIWSALERRGLYENTMVVLVSDHGEMLGDHGLWMKGPFHYEPLVKVPLLIKPAKSDSRKPLRPETAVVSLTDVAPTCLVAAGLDVGKHELDGIDLLTTSDATTDDKSDRAVLVETTQHWHAMVCRSIVCEDWKLTWFADEEFGELYDLKNDPNEMRNLWDTEQNHKIQLRLLSRLLTMQVEMSKSEKERIAYA